MVLLHVAGELDDHVAVEREGLATLEADELAGRAVPGNLVARLATWRSRLQRGSVSGHGFQAAVDGRASDSRSVRRHGRPHVVHAEVALAVLREVRRDRLPLLRLVFSLLSHACPLF